jgi:autotransporter adhesin
MGSANAIYATTSTAIGFGNKVGDKINAKNGLYFQGSTVIGTLSSVYGSRSVVIGDRAEAGGSDSVGSTSPFANQAVAIGSQARARVDGTIAIGDSALAGISDLTSSGSNSYPSTNAIAIGTNAKVYGTTTTTGFNSIALGASAQSTGDNSASLGAGSSDGGQSNVVAVGNSSSQRRIINLAAGVDPTDGVNVSQLKSMETSLTNQMNSISDKAYAGTATVAAIAGIPALPEGKNFNVGAGFGNYHGQSGVAIGGNVRLTGKMALKAAVGYANSKATTSVGLGFAF